jgi:hypothetical protein
MAENLPLRFQPSEGAPGGAHEDLVDRTGPGDVFVGLPAEPFHFGVQRPVDGQEHEGNRRRLRAGAGLVEEGEPVFALQDGLCHHGVEAVGPDELRRLAHGGRGRHVVAALAECELHDAQGRHVLVDDEDPPSPAFLPSVAHRVCDLVPGRAPALRRSLSGRRPRPSPSRVRCRAVMVFERTSAVKRRVGAGNVAVARP